MEGFDFRLRFHLLEGDTINHDSGELVVLQEDDGRTLRLKSGAQGAAIKDRSRAALIGGPYASEQEAREAANRAKRALLIWAVKQRVGIDLGDGTQRFHITPYGLQMLEQQHRQPVRPDVHGIDVFPHQEGTLFAAVDMKASVGKSPGTFAEIVAKEFQLPPALTDKQVVAAELFCSAFFDVSLRSRIITLVSSVEALLEPAERSSSANALVDAFVTQVRTVGLDEQTTQSMIGSLGWLRRDSISQTGRRLGERLLPGRTYLDQSPSQFFTFVYDLRSALVHEGHPQDAAIDLLRVANEWQAFVGDLLLASFDGAPRT